MAAKKTASMMMMVHPKKLIVPGAIKARATKAKRAKVVAIAGREVPRTTKAKKR